MRRFRRQFIVGGVGVVAVLGALTSAGSGAPPACNLTQLQLRDSTVNQGLGSYDRIVRGKETLVRMYFSMPSCHDNNDSIQITGGTLSATGGGATLADGVVGTPSPVSTYPTAATYATAPVNDSTADVKFIVSGSALAPGATTDAYTASFSATITFQYKTSATATPVVSSRTLTAFTTKTVEKKTNALRILVVPMGNAANAYSSEFPAAAVAAIENGMQTLSRLFPVPSGVTTLGTESGGIRYAIDSTLLDVGSLMNADGKLCGSGLNFDAIKAQLAQFLVSWNTANPTAPADRVVGAISSDKSLGSSSSCAEGMASLISPEAWVRAIPDSATPSNTGALLAMEIGHTFGLTPATRSFGFRHSLNTAADGTSPNRGYNVASRSFLADDRTAMALSGTTWNNNTTLLEKEDYAYLLCALGGQVNTECTTSAVAGTVGGVAAIASAFAATGTTDGTPTGTAVEESFVAGLLEEFGTHAASSYQLVQREPGGNILRADGVRVSFDGSVHDDDSPAETPTKGTFAFVVTAHAAADKFELWSGTPGAGTLLWSTLKTNRPSITSFTSTGAGFTEENYTDTSPRRESQPALTVNGEWVAWSREGSIYVGPRSDSTESVTVPKPALLGRNGPIVFSSDRDGGDGDYDIWTMNGDGSNPVQITNTSARDGDPQWSPDNSKIIFVRNGNIWSMDADGLNEEQLTTAGGRDPSVAPDGRIAFISTRDNLEAELYVMNHDGSGQTRLTINSALEQDTAWSPRNDVIAFASTRSGQWRLYTTAPDGTGQAQVPGSLDGDLNPSFSPDGEKIAFFRAWCCDGVDVDLGYMGIDGTGRTQLTNTSPESESDPSWSGDGTEIVFRTRSSGVDSQSQIQVFNLATGERSSLTNNEADDTDPSWQVIRPSAGDPAWNQSSDAVKGALAFVSEGDLYTISVGLSGAIPSFGSPKRVYTSDDEGNGPASDPTWNQDATEIAFAESKGGGDFIDLVVVDLRPDGGLRSLTDDANIANPSWSRTAGDDRIAFDQSGEVGREVWVTDASNEPFSSLLVSDARQPAWGTDGRISFTRDGGIWIFDFEDESEEQATEDGFDSDFAGGTLAFVRTFFFGTENSQTDIIIGTPGGGRGTTVDVEVTDDNAADNRLDLLADCGGLVYVAAVALEPDEASGATASWTTNFDPSLTCENPTLKVAVSDGYNRVVSSTGEAVQAEQKPPTAAIYTPSIGATFRQYELVPARGSGWDAEDGTLPAAQLQWQLSGPGGSSATGSGAIVDFSPEAGGWFPLGDYTLTLTVTDAAGNSDSAMRAFTVVGDADNDGLTDAEESLPCITFEPEFLSAANDPLNAFRDDDGDGLVNVDDPAPCTAASEYEAFVEFDPIGMALGSNGVVTARVSIPNRNASDVSTAYVKSINGIDVSGNALFRARQWNVARGTNLGQAKIDRTPLNTFFTAHDIANQSVRIVIAGSGGNGTWTFEGVGTLLVR